MKKFVAERKERKALKDKTFNAKTHIRKDIRYAYMDLTDFYHEVGEAAGGNTVWATPEDLLECSPCAIECGIARVKIVYDKEILPSNHTSAGCLSFADIEEKSAKWFQHEMCSLKHKEDRVKRLEATLKLYKKLIKKSKADMRKAKRGNKNA